MKISPTSVHIHFVIPQYVPSSVQTSTDLTRLCQTKARMLHPVSGTRESTRACARWAESVSLVHMFSLHHTALQLALNTLVYIRFQSCTRWRDFYSNQWCQSSVLKNLLVNGKLKVLWLVTNFKMNSPSSLLNCHILSVIVLSTTGHLLSFSLSIWQNGMIRLKLEAGSFPI